jgi:hypothetical protein
VPSSIDRAIARLYAGPLSEFTRSRDALVAELMADGRLDDAGTVKALSKPTLSAWSIDALMANDPSGIARLRAAGDRARAAQLGRDRGAPIVERVAEAKSIAADLRDRALSLAEAETGKRPSAAIAERIAKDLDAIAFLPDAAASGWIARDLEPPGLDLLEDEAVTRARRHTTERSSRRTRAASASRARRRVAQAGRSKAHAAGTSPHAAKPPRAKAAR